MMGLQLFQTRRTQSAQWLFDRRNARNFCRFSFVTVVSLVFNRQNKSPTAFALGDWFPSRTYLLTGKASPNDSEIVIVVVIIIGEAIFRLHGDGIIAQTVPPDIPILAMSSCRSK
jgi:hypothetical protein